MLLTNETVSIYVSRPSHTPLKTSYIVTIQMTRERTSTYLKIDNLVWYDLQVQCFFENCGIYAQSCIQSKNANLTGHITYEIFNNYHIFSVPAIQKDWTKCDNQRYDFRLIALFILVVISYKWSAKVYCLYLRTNDHTSIGVLHLKIYDIRNTCPILLLFHIHLITTSYKLWIIII